MGTTVHVLAYGTTSLADLVNIVWRNCTPGVLRDKDVKAKVYGEGKWKGEWDEEIWETMLGEAEDRCDYAPEVLGARMEVTFV